MKRVETEIIIEADKRKIWTVLTNLDSYEQWCSAIQFPAGKAEKDAIVTMTTATPDGSGKTYTGKGKIIKLIPYQSLVWQGGMKGILVGHHFWHLSEQGDGTTRLVQGEDFYGLYAWLMSQKKLASFQPFYENISQELKQYVEGI
ncbi:SRPBCC domain-containing protein [Tunicatimonas pelagia]|uniref:SRPBCC domain-containing protein n=1 Tax=Tunicatimonas pelagia TaxID=931531 RepID=UPI0026663220|nr:SRPBCC domain-containing protein [Tunicatimonas pelagia]WKN42066.1 SRPBCC domain-containing protein [Tunicatimonas pelagia]